MQYVMIRLKMVGDGLRIAGFIPLWTIKADRECLERAQPGFVRVGNHRAGIQTTAQTNAQWFFTHQPDADTLCKELVQFFRHFTDWPRSPCIFLNPQVPVAADCGFSITKTEPVRRRQLPDASEHGSRFRNKSMSKIRNNRLRVRFAQLTNCGTHGFAFRPPYQTL